ncbi:MULTISPECIES: TetR family transcriptional regulator [Actibacterium]|uniref:TetR/AcrR family acrAB operon transcriptional repressor n=1 Tax=Actibacterium naphthalenivorans TaxID=1614693 RepID=A0A840CCQ9_9RHOB|nr:MULTISPECIES: TetR family transcriptional regulator [Actibacterium]ALG90853.1 hypothetical protein TQ29_12415 [Actibacterium sp. EMB200-NS6]MBB4023844.1 TetR/AcrR family acrAB operon transcriptional repressor [Actibacterium naphthalenivorans]
MRKTKKDAEQTRIAILDAAESLFCTQGTATATLEKISRAAGVTRGALYWHFTDKLDILRALHARSVAPQENLIRTAAESGHDDPLGLLEQASIEMLKTFEKDEHQQRLFTIMTAHRPDEEGAAWFAEVNANMFKTLTRLTVQARDLGMLSPDLTPEETAVMMMSTMNGLLSEWLRCNRSFALVQLGSKLLRKQMAFIRVQRATA